MYNYDDILTLSVPNKDSYLLLLFRKKCNLFWHPRD